MTGSQLRHVGLRLDRYELLEPGEVETEMFGFWIFLMSDAVLFALLFALYGVQLAATAGAPGPAEEFKLGAPSARRWCSSPAASPLAWRPWR